jgi:hypothetical protein
MEERKPREDVDDDEVRFCGKLEVVGREVVPRKLRWRLLKKWRLSRSGGLCCAWQTALDVVSNILGPAGPVKYLSSFG